MTLPTGRKTIKNTPTDIAAPSQSDGGALRRLAGSQGFCDCLAAVALFLLSVLLFLYCKKGGSIAIDEAFYLTIPKRLLDGDGLLTDEWHLSQLSSVLLLPLVRLWYLFHDGADGMYVAFSGLFVLFQGLTCGAVYAMLRKYKYAALLGAVCVSQYSLMNYHALSYNTFGFYAALLLMCVLYRLAQKPSKPLISAAGALYAALVLCNPVTAVLFPVCCAAAAVSFIREKAGTKKRDALYCLFDYRGFLFFAAGILALFLYFLAVLFRNTSFPDIFANLPYILSDSEHMTLASGQGEATVSVLRWFREIARNTGLAPLIVSCAMWLAAIPARKKNGLFALCLSFAAFAVLFISAFVFYCSPEKETVDPGLLFLAVLAVGGASYFLGGRRHKALFYTFICGGLFYSVCMDISSNLGYHAQINGFAAACPGAVILTLLILSEAAGGTDKRVVITGIRSAAAVFAAFCLLLTGTYVFSVRGTFGGERRFRFADGFYRGYFAEKDEYADYLYLASDIAALDELASDGERLFVINNLPVCYLMTEKMSIGAPTAWFFTDGQLSFAEGRNRLLAYYKLHPENVPDYIYIAPFGVYSDGTRDIYPEEYYRTFVLPYFEGEKIKLDHGLAMKVSGLKEYKDLS